MSRINWGVGRVYFIIWGAKGPVNKIFLTLFAACGVPTAKRPQDKGPEKSGNPRCVPLVARHAFANGPQNFGALSYTDEDRQGEESHDKTEATWFQFLVKVAESPPKSLENIAVARLGIAHRKDAAGLGQ